MTDSRKQRMAARSKALQELAKQHPSDFRKLYLTHLDKLGVDPSRTRPLPIDKARKQYQELIEKFPELVADK
jgi:hypothetical protein